MMQNITERDQTVDKNMFFNFVIFLYLLSFISKK